MSLLDRFRVPKPAETEVQVKLEDATYEELIAENRRLGELQDRIKERRRVLAARADANLRKGR